ncbi:MAG: helicase-exonuclease AddAB subunit AddB [Syntrophomonadaceae bacterium]
MRYILGRAGSGKSQRVMEEIKQSLLDGSQEQLILLVPEQFTLQAERDLLGKMNLPGLMRAEVLSFSRLAGRVFSEVGGTTRTLLNEQGKQMILRKVADGLSPRLTLYKKAAAQEGFISQLSDMIGELKRQNIDPNQLLECSGLPGEPLLNEKVHEIGVLYAGFTQYLAGRYLDNEDYLNLLCEKIAMSQLVNGARIWLDSYTTFSSQTLMILDKLMPLAAEISVCLTLDHESRARDRELFALSRRSLEKIRNLAGRHHLAEEFICLSPLPSSEGKDPALAHLERELHAYPASKYPSETESLEVFAAANLCSEVEFAAAQIIHLVRERAWRWKEVAVVCNDMSHYGGLIKRVFNEYKIPVFMDKMRDIMNNPLIKVLLSSGEVIRKGYKYYDVFTLIKTGLTPLDDDAAEELENIVLGYGIRGSAWKQPFDLPIGEPGEQVNHWRETFVSPLTTLEKAWAGKNQVEKFCRAHFNYLLEAGIQARLQEWIEALERGGRYEAVRENAQIWNIVIDIFDQMVEIMGDQEISLREYLNILESGFAAIEVGIIPTTVDQVLVGSIQRTKSQDVKALLVLGANDGILPALGETEGLLSEREKMKLQESGFDLDFESQMLLAEERLLLYDALSKPRNYLGISFALADGDGKAVRPSLLIDRLKRLFPALQVKTDVVSHRHLELHQVTTPASTFKYLVQNLRLSEDGKPIEDVWIDVKGWYSSQLEWQPRLAWLQKALVHHNQADDIGRDQARLLYSQPIRTTVSRIEQFVQCPFAHFVRYGLSPQERLVYEVAPPDIGELFHHCLLDFVKQLSRDNLDWFSLQRADAERIANRVMDELIPRHGHGIFASSHRYTYLALRLKRIARRTIWILTEHLKRGEFEPLEHEVSFGRDGTFPPIEVELGSGDKLYLEGRIDRVDLLDNGESDYVKIIDYKSGQAELRLSDVYYGIALQLIIYMQALLNSRKESDAKDVKPGGIFYFHIDDPMVDSKDRLQELIEMEIAKQFKLKGIVLKDVEIVRKMDCLLAATGNTDILPVAINGSGDFSKRSAVLAESQFYALLSHVEGLLRKIGGEIMNGKVRIEPIRNRGQIACSYCSFGAICQFDRSLSDNNYRVLRPLDDEEVLKRLEGGIRNA